MAGELGHLYDSTSYGQLPDDERARMWKLVLTLRGETAARVPAWGGDEFVVKQEDREVKRRLHPLSIMFQRDAYTALRFAQGAPALPAAPTPTGGPPVVAAPYPPDPVDAPPQASGAVTTARG
jgi:hypothetical protein